MINSSEIKKKKKRNKMKNYNFSTECKTTKNREIMYLGESRN